MNSPISPAHTGGLPAVLDDWDARAVTRWLDALKLGQHARVFAEHGVLGTVLPLVDDEALADMGIRSVGQRIALLNAIYALKKKHGIPVHASQDYVPASFVSSDPSSLSTGQAVPDDSRITALELHVASLAQTLKALQRMLAPSTPAPLAAPCSACGRYTCSCSAPTPLSAPASATISAQVLPAPRRRKPPTSPHPPASPTSPASPPHSASSAPPGPLRLPTTTPGSAPAQIPMPHPDPSPSPRRGSASSPTSQSDPKETRDKEDKELAGSRTATPGTAPSGAPANRPESSAASKLTFDHGGGQGKDAAPAIEASGSSALASRSNGPGSVYKSFRVTMEDPTDKVLPAALKKYKIVDDWKQYVLFICYHRVPGASGAGDQERCMSLDERPLLLFQKLRDQNQNPVFMLRHIRDIKSPEAIARGKQVVAQAAREQLNEARKRAATEGQAIDSAASFLTTEDDAPPPVMQSLVAARREWVIASRMGLNPTIGDDMNLSVWAGPNVSLERASSARVAGPAANLSTLPTPTYAVAIYPYTKERADELNVTVGDSYIVLSKAKGWWIVQGDPMADGTGAYDYDLPGAPPSSLPGPVEGTRDLPLVRTTGWVPAGCLLETSHPLLGSSAPIRDLKRVTSLPIAPSLILSTSTPGIVLMSYDAQAFAAVASSPPSGPGSGAGPGAPTTTDQGEPWLLPKDTHLRVFKRYNHWSYCVQETGPFTRGWVPSWCTSLSLLHWFTALASITDPRLHAVIGKGSAKSRSGRGNTS